MKSPLFKLLLSLLTLFLFKTSFAQTATHQDDLIYYTTIAAQIKDAAPKIQGLWGQVQQSIMTAGENKTHQADRQELDNLKNVSAQNISDLDRKLRMVSALHETDAELNLKELCISMFADAKNVQQAAMPQIIALLEKGIDKISPQQTSLLKNFLSKGQDLLYRFRNIQTSLISYQDRHQISSDELRKFGL